jgi:hypothetical protein
MRIQHSTRCGNGTRRREFPAFHARAELGTPPALRRTMKTQTAVSVVSLALLSLAAEACGTSTISAQVVSCADNRPVPDAKLTYHAQDETPDGELVLNELPGVTSQDGTVKSDITTSRGTTYAMTIQKEGYATKTAQLTSGSDQTVCLQPTQ